MIFGKVPFKVDNVIQLYEKFLFKKKCRIPNNLNISNNSKDILSKLLLMNPDQRPSI